MKYTNEIEINLPRQRMIELFDNPAHMKNWQPSLVSFEHLSGTPGQLGAKSKLKYKTGKREVELIETITVRNLPDEFSGTYEAKGIYNHIVNKFIPVSENKTKWVSHTEFKFNGLFMKIIAFLMPGAFMKESQKHLEMFKKFAESY
jgi:hypothetical protein